MTHYWINLFHMYLVHVGAWSTYYGAIAIKDGKRINFLRLLTVSGLLAIGSSIAHNHYMQFLGKS